MNLREQAGVDRKLLAVLDRDARVQVLGERQGDWWQVRAEKEGLSGWVSSLWLRRLNAPK